MNQFGDLIKLLDIVNDMNKRGKASDSLLESLTLETVTFYNITLSTKRMQQQKPQVPEGMPEDSFPLPLGETTEEPKESREEDTNE